MKGLFKNTNHKKDEDVPFSIQYKKDTMKGQTFKGSGGHSITHSDYVTIENTLREDVRTFRRFYQEDIELSRQKVERCEKLRRKEPVEEILDFHKDFNVGKTLGQGTFGKVFYVEIKPGSRDKMVGLKDVKKSNFALKILSKRRMIGGGTAGDTKKSEINHTLAERRITYACKDCNFIVGFYGSFCDKKFVYFILEFAYAGELFDHIQLIHSLNKMNDNLIRFLFGQMVLAFSYLKRNRILHRDIKPENILMDEIGYIKLTDFGFAVQITEEAKRRYTFCGTPEYIAPDIINCNQGYIDAVDWWSLGILLYEIAYSFAPFRHKVPSTLYNMISNDQHKFPKHGSNEMKNLIDKLLEKKEKDRFGGLKDDVYDVMNHPFFDNLKDLREFDAYEANLKKYLESKSGQEPKWNFWKALYDKQIESPYKPKLAKIEIFQKPGDISSLNLELANNSPLFDEF